MFPFWIEIEPASLAQLVALLLGGLAVLFSLGVLHGGRA